VLGRNRLSLAKSERAAPGVSFMKSFTISANRINEPSHDKEKSKANSLRLFIPAGNADIQYALKNCKALAAWAGRNQYNALIFPLTVFGSGKNKRELNQLKQFALESGIALEAGGWDLSSMVPRRYFFFHKDAFRMEEGKRKKDHHFCPTSLNAIKIIGKEGAKIFLAAAGIEVFHLWPDKEAETIWCSCPTCRAFTFQEQIRIGVNAAADILTAINPNAAITYFEKSNEVCKIPLRKNIIGLENFTFESQNIGSLGT